MVAQELFAMHGCKGALPSAHQHPLLPAAAVPKPPFRDSPSHPAASARGSQPGCDFAAHQGEGFGGMRLEGPVWVACPVSPSPHPLFLQLLQYNPKRRLGCGGGGIAKLKSHSFFSNMPWNKLVG